MTTVAWDGKTLAADRQAEWGTVKFETQKLRQVGQFMFAGAGRGDDIERTAEWLAAGAKPAARPQLADAAAALAVDIPTGVCLLVTGEFPVLRPVVSKFLAVGAGADVAMTAMHFGKSAREAILLASQIAVGTGFGVDVYVAEPKGRRRRKP